MYENRSKGQAAPSDRRSQGQSFSKPLPQSLMEIDKDIARLLARRAKLLHKANHGRRGTDPALEKQLRQSWEANAVELSRDPRFIRQFFTLMQEVEVNTQEADAPRTGFHLAPARRPLDVKMKGPSASRLTRLWLTLAAATSRNVTIDSVLVNDPFNDLLKALNLCGASVAWNESTGCYCKAESKLDFTDKVLYIGEDTLNLYMFIFLAVGANSRLKLTGGTDLKFLDLAPLAHFLPQLGARLTNVVAGTKGLPVRLECSGVYSDAVTIPADLPADAITALILAACTWDKAVSIALQNSPAGIACLDEILPLLQRAGVKITLEGTTLHIVPSKDAMPETFTQDMVAMHVDTLLATSLLAFPVFAGGKVSMTGTWPSDAEGDTALALLKAGGLRVSISAGVIESEYSTSASADYNALLSAMPATYAPIALAFVAASVAANTDARVAMPQLPDSIPASVAEDFLAQIGLEPLGHEGETPALRPTKTPIAAGGWASPAPEWSMALAMASFLRSGLRIANPGNMTALMPNFWHFFNGLPSPNLAPKSKEETSNDKPNRRRIIAG